MQQTRCGTVVEADIHGLTADDAKRQLEQLLTRLPADVTEVAVIHGYHGGQTLCNMVRRRLKHPRIRAKVLDLNQGETRLLLCPPNRPNAARKGSATGPDGFHRRPGG